jgi:O-antigen/teichoic acid export membrane protein
MFDNLRRVSRQLLAYGTADAAVLAVNFLLLPVYTRVLQPAEYGALALLLVFEAVLKPTLRSGLDSAYLRLYFDYPRPADRRSLAKTVLVFILALNGSALVLLWPLSSWLTRLAVGDLQYVSALQLVALNTGLSNLAFLPFCLFRVQERSALVGSLTFLRSFSTIVVRLVLVVGFRQGVFGLALADVIVTTVLVLALTPTLVSMIGGTFSRPMLRALLRYGFPQVPQGLLSQVMSMSDRYVLGMFLPLRDLGVYSIGSTMASVLKLYPVAFESAWMPFAFSSLTRRDAPLVFARMASYAFAVLCFAALGVVLLAEPVTRLVLPVSYHRAPAVVPLLALGITIQAAAWFMATSINVAKRTSRHPVATAAGAAASLLGSVALIPRFGVMGAAAGVLCGQVALATTTAWFAQRYYPIPYEAARLAKTTAATAALAAIGLLARGPTPAWNLVGAVALLAAYPVVLLAWRFLQRWEADAIRQFLRARGSGARGGTPGEPGRP